MLYDWSWWNWFWASATTISSLMLIIKIKAYLVELRWQRGAAPTVRWEWANRRKDSALPVEESFLNLQVHLCRPELIFLRIQPWIKPKILQAAFHFLWTTPFLVLVSSISMTMAGNAPSWLLDVSAVLISLTVAIALLTALSGRFLFGPLDTLNIDLKPRAGFNIFPVADMAQLRLIYYFAVLVFIAVVGGAGASAAVSNAHAGAFTGSGLRAQMHPAPNIDPVPYVYFSVVTIATVGYGDISPQSDLARLLTILHIATGPLLFTWLIAMFTQTSVQVLTEYTDKFSANPAIRTECRNHKSESCPWRLDNPLKATPDNST